MGERAEKRGGALTGPVVIRRNPEVAGRALQEGEGFLLLHKETGAYHRLNRTGGLIWGALEEPTRFDELERRLRSEFGDPPMLAEDLAAYVAELAERDLVHLERQTMA